MSEGNLLFQSEKHPLVPETYSSIETYCLSLIHRRAYERAAEECLVEDAYQEELKHFGYRFD